MVNASPATTTTRTTTMISSAHSRAVMRCLLRSRPGNVARSIGRISLSYNEPRSEPARWQDQMVLVREGPGPYARWVVDDVLWLEEADGDGLKTAHAAGRPVAAHASTPEGVRDALAHPEVACVLVPREHPELLELDLTQLTYG